LRHTGIGFRSAPYFSSSRDLATQRQRRLLLVERRHEDRRFRLDDRVERAALV
jgi:hypothetical protein